MKTFERTRASAVNTSMDPAYAAGHVRGIHSNVENLDRMRSNSVLNPQMMMMPEEAFHDNEQPNDRSQELAFSPMIAFALNIKNRQT